MREGTLLAGLGSLRIKILDSVVGVELRHFLDAFMREEGGETFCRSTLINKRKDEGAKCLCMFRLKRGRSRLLSEKEGSDENDAEATHGDLRRSIRYIPFHHSCERFITLLRECSSVRYRS